MKAETIEIKNNTNKNIVVTIQEEPDLQETFKAVEKAIKIFTETLEKTLQPLAELLNRPEVVKALEAVSQENDECPDTLEGADRAIWYDNKANREKERLDEEIEKSFEVHVKKYGNDFSLFSCYKAGYIAGREGK